MSLTTCLPQNTQRCRRITPPVCAELTCGGDLVGRQVLPRLRDLVTLTHDLTLHQETGERLRRRDQALRLQEVVHEPRVVEVQNGCRRMGGN